MVKTVVATKILNKFIMHNFLEKGGTIIFNKYNFGLEIGGEGNFREIKLITFPETEKYTTIINTAPRKKKINLNTQEDASEEL